MEDALMVCNSNESGSVLDLKDCGRDFNINEMRRAVSTPVSCCFVEVNEVGKYDRDGASTLSKREAGACTTVIDPDLEIFEMRTSMSLTVHVSSLLLISGASALCGKSLLRSP